MIQTRKSHHDIVSLLYTFSVATSRAHIQGAIGPAIAALVALGQMRASFPSNFSKWKVFALLALLPLSALLNHLYGFERVLEGAKGAAWPSGILTVTNVRGPMHPIEGAAWPSGILTVTNVTGPMHPIEALAADAKTRFSAMLEKQSKTLDQAIAEYTRRYKRSPPPHFD